MLVTDNASDFRPMFARDEIHPGLAVMPAEHGRASQQRLAGRLIDVHRRAGRSRGRVARRLHGQPARRDRRRRTRRARAADRLPARLTRRISGRRRLCAAGLPDAARSRASPRSAARARHIDPKGDRA